MADTSFNVFGAGDPGTVELLDRLRERNIPHKFIDIRKRPAKSNQADPLRYLGSRRLQTVPQVFRSDDVYIGNFDAMVEYMDRPDTIVNWPDAAA